jgi:hypothetical protein
VRRCPTPQRSCPRFACWRRAFRLFCRFTLQAGFVAFRQTFVQRCQDCGRRGHPGAMQGSAQCGWGTKAGGIGAGPQAQGAAALTRLRLARVRLARMVVPKPAGRLGRRSHGAAAAEGWIGRVLIIATVRQSLTDVRSPNLNCSEVLDRERGPRGCERPERFQVLPDVAAAGLRLQYLIDLVWPWFGSPYFGLAARRMRTPEPSHWRFRILALICSFVPLLESTDWTGCEGG